MLAQMDVSGRSVVYFRTLMSLYNPLISGKFSSGNLSFSDTVTHHKANAPHTSLTGSPHAGQRGAGTCYIQQGCTFATVREPSMRTRCVYHSFRACATTSPPAALYVNGPVLTVRGQCAFSILVRASPWVTRTCMSGGLQAHGDRK